MSDPSESTDRPLIAYLLDGAEPLTIEPASSDRDWMHDQRGLAMGCLPMTIANQAGWFIRCPIGFTVWWDGGMRTDALRIRLDDQPSATEVPDLRGVHSGFGNGVISFIIPYVFRTPTGVNLWIKGPPNFLKDGAQPLEGIVETDWCPMSFTMNWKITCQDEPVHFAKDEPICMMVPIPRGFAETFDPHVEHMANNPELARAHREWGEKRDVTLQRKGFEPSDIPRWEKDYYKGQMPDGTPIPEHQMKLRIRPFRTDGTT